MLTRFDHAVIAVRDLDDAMRVYRHLGFAVGRGGRHLGHGTENALIRFGLDYLELLAVADLAEARASGLNGRDLQDVLQARDGGLAGFALASDDLGQDVARLRAAGVAVEGPFSMRRERPDGSVLAWQLAIPGGTPWRRPWPFLIQWETPDAERLTHDQSAAQPNGVVGVAGVGVAVRDLDAAIALYDHGLGVALTDRGADTAWRAEAARFVVGETRIELLAPHEGSPLAHALADEGEGPAYVRLAAADIEATRRVIADAGTAVGTAGPALLVPPAAALGARLIIAAKSE